MISWWWLIFTAVGGAVVGLFVTCMCVAAGRADEETEGLMRDQFRDGGHF